MKKYRVLCIYDVHVDTPKGRIGWAYWRRCSALQRYAPPDFEVDIAAYADVRWGKTGNYNLVYNTEYAAPSRHKIPGHVPLCISYNSDSRRRRNYWGPVQKQATFTIFNNAEAFDHFGRPKHSCCISNGVDAEIFRPTVPIQDRPHRLLWCGSSTATKGKGYEEVFRPLEKLAPQYGFEADFRPINEIKPGLVYGTDEQVAWYNSGSYILCASLTEGTPGIITEGVSCGCVAVSVSVGNIQEWGRDGENCVIVERSPESFLEGLQYARERREELSKAGADTIRSGWGYGSPGERASYFFQLFRRIIDDGADSVSPFSFLEKHWSEV